MTLIVGVGIISVICMSAYIFAKVIMETSFVYICLAIVDVCVLREIFKSFFKELLDYEDFDEEEFD